MSDLIPLAQARCAPRKGSEHKLSPVRIQELLPQVPGWEMLENGHALGRTYAFSDYYRTLSFVNALEHMANRENHHPDLQIGRAHVLTPITNIHSVCIHINLK